MSAMAGWFNLDSHIKSKALNESIGAKHASRFCGMLVTPQTV